MKCHLYNSLAMLVLVIGLSGVVAAQSQPDESGPDVARTGTISGQVVTDGGQPLANVVVGIHTYGAGGPGRTTTTDNEGRFQVSGLEPVAYLVSASFPA